MAPLRVVDKNIPTVTCRSGINTRNKTALTTLQTKTLRNKRKAECSPTKDQTANMKKRSAFGDLTSNINQMVTKRVTAVDKTKPSLIKPPTKVVVKSKQLPVVKTVAKPKQNENLPPPNAPEMKMKTRLSMKAPTDTETVVKPKEPMKEANGKVKTRLSNEFEKTEETLYFSTLEDVSAKGPMTRSMRESPKDEAAIKQKQTNVSMVASEFQRQLNLNSPDIPEGVDDFDKENLKDVNQSSEYAMDIFNYLKQREENQIISDYMSQQKQITIWMRSLLVDWMVEIQESFELNHETLYLGVKLVDMYLSKVQVSKDRLQLVGATAMFVASKFDERIPPLIDDFVFVCDGAYKRHELIKMEINLVKICDFNLGVSISYRFLRRYARCAKVTMPILTLARYILESSLLNYKAVSVRESKRAAAALYMALKMKKVGGWSASLEYYTGYKLQDIISTVYLLNDDLHSKPRVELKTIRNKYSHKIFFEVAKTPLITNEDLKP